MLLAVCHSAQSGWSQVEDLDRISDLRESGDHLLWVEGAVQTLEAGDIALISEEFGLHPLAVEDALNTRQRPKFEPFEHHLFIVLHELDEHNGQLEAVQIACFVGSSYVLTLHDGAERTIKEAKERWAKREQEAGRGSEFLVHTLLDVIVDDYQEIADRLEDEIEELEDKTLKDASSPIQTPLYSLKQQLSRLRRYSGPIGRELDLAEASRPDFFTPDTAAYFRDVHDHILRIEDQIRNIDELAQAVLDLHRSEQAKGLNEVTKRLTGWAAIIAVPTFIASVYGMNFRLVPADGRIFGFWFALVLMGMTSLGLYVYFKKRGWI
jgi:magnesium transporter